jgi:porin
LRSNENYSSQLGDDTVGFQYPRIFKGNELSMLTYEQHLLGNRLDIEFGRSNPMRYFGLPTCQDSLTCFDDVYSFDADAVPIIHSNWMGRIKYNLTDAWYVQAGGSEDNHSVVHTNGYDWNGTGATGALALGEVGYRTTFATAKYPEEYELIGYYNSTTHLDPLYTISGNSKILFPKETALGEHGTGGIMGDAQKLVWRADGGHGNTHYPFSLMSYGGFGYSPDNTVPVKADIYGGLTLQSPFQSRPLDQYGVEIHWSRLTNREYEFLQDSYSHAGGVGSIAGSNKVIFEVNSQIRLLRDVFIQPSVQYVVNPNDYYAPTSRNYARNGVVVTATLVWHAGQSLGLSAPNF